MFEDRDRQRCSSESRDGSAPPESAHIERTRYAESEFEIVFGNADIRNPTNWKICDDRSTVIVHLSGRMDSLETELEGHGGSSGPALPGEVWTVPPGHTYHSQACGGTIAYAAIYFDHRFGSNGMPDGIRAVAGKRDVRLFQAVQSLARNAQRDTDTALLAVSSSIDQIRGHLRCQYSANPTTTVFRPIPALNASQCRIVREYILDSITEKIALERLAYVVGLSVHHFLVAFRKSFSTTPAQFIIDQRVRTAQRMLLNGDHDISTIALKCGFYSHSHLSTVFQRRTGESPSAFRATGKNEEIH
jgi:AraC family transcriptional regulator